MAMKILIVGHGGREGAFAKKLYADGAAVFAWMAHANPTIVDCARNSGGGYCIGDVCDGAAIADYALQKKTDYVFVNADEPLARGVVDVLLKKGIRAVGPTKAAAKIEWDKLFAMRMMQKLFPQFTPFFCAPTSPDEINSAIKIFQNKRLEIAVKPTGLTGGKGVRVMGGHLQSYQAAADYARRLLQKDGAVLLVEKLTGPEFTLMAVTDGARAITAPATYDYPYRHENDRGPGTGGMGCFAESQKLLPFMTTQHYQICEKIMNTVIKNMARQGLRFNGVLNGGFFLTARGIKFMEFNSRFGDPEGINILSLLESSFANLLAKIDDKNLQSEDAVFRPQASVVKYLVSPAYPGKSSPITFKLPAAAIEKEGVSLIFSAAVADGDGYKTVGSSRVAALECKAEAVVDACEIINRCIKKHLPAGALDYRADIGCAAEMERLKKYPGE